MLFRSRIMSAFHATFSVGGVVAALVGARATSAGMGPAATLGAAGAAGIVIALLPARGVLATAPASPPPGPTAAERQRGPAAKRRTVPGRIWILSALALMCMLCEGAANDWSALHLKDILGAPASTAAFAYGTFAATMTIGRLLADRLVARFGSMAILRHGATTAAVGITIVTVSPWIWAAFAGWALFGLGLSGCVPQLFSAAGHADPSAAGANVSRVAGLGYVGMLAGPAVIGWLTHLVALNHAFVLLILLCATTAVAAGILRTDSDRTPEPAHSTH